MPTTRSSTIVSWRLTDKDLEIWQALEHDYRHQHGMSPTDPVSDAEVIRHVFTEYHAIRKKEKENS